ncbi:hypothetical protein B484DRAFT_320002, partial [Ochromonadaceae sp. CCMP2298]
MCMYVYTCVCIYVYVCVYTYLYVCICVRVMLYIHVNVCISDIRYSSLLLNTHPPCMSFLYILANFCLLSFVLPYVFLYILTDLFHYLPVFNILYL